MTESATLTRITLVRHGDVHNPDNIIYGRLPGFRLSDVGVRQVEAAAETLAAAELTALYSSPQLRAQQTAEILRRHHPEAALITSQLIDEIDSYFEGRPAEVVEARGWDLYTGVGEGYETPEVIGKRAGRFISKIRARYDEGHIAAVTHGDVIAFGVLWAVHEPLEMRLKRTLHRFGVSDRYPATASLTTLTYYTDDPDEVPEIAYVRPYGEKLMRAALS